MALSSVLRVADNGWAEPYDIESFSYALRRSMVCLFCYLSSIFVLIFSAFRITMAPETRARSRSTSVSSRFSYLDEDPTIDYAAEGMARNVSRGGSFGRNQANECIFQVVMLPFCSSLHRRSSYF